MRPLTLFIGLFSGLFLFGGDTLRFQSRAFEVEREVVVHVPMFHAASSPEVRMPVIIVLDGQHDWFTQPVLSDITYLQYTHQVPQAITVVVPLTDRVKECADGAGDDGSLPLLRMLTEELPPLLARYHPGEYTVLVGHSFTASFALYAKHHAPDAFNAVIALSPLHRVGEHLPAVLELIRHRSNDDVLLAVGGPDRQKDGGHYGTLMETWRGLPAAKDRMLLKEYPSAGHTSLPVVAFPELLTILFNDFSLRDTLAPVDDEYKLLQPPSPPAGLLSQVEAGLYFRGKQLPWEVAEINGLASRLQNSGYVEQALAVYLRGVELYPRDAWLNAALGDLLLPRDRSAGEAALRRALKLVDDDAGLTPADRIELREDVEKLLR